MDLGSKLIRKIAFNPAAPRDSTVFEDLVCEDERSLFGDKAYDRDSLKQIARDKDWYYGILDKGKRNDPLSSTQKKRNNVEASIWHLTHTLSKSKTSYRGLIKHKLSAWCQALWVNMKRIQRYIGQSDGSGEENQQSTPIA